MKANYEQKHVVMRHLGKKPSAICSQQLSQGDSVCLASGDAFWLLPDKYKHVVKFRDTKNSQMESAASHKRCADDDGISAESLSKRKSSASSTSAHSNRHDIDVCDKEQDSDTEQVDMVCDM